MGYRFEGGYLVQISRLKVNRGGIAFATFSDFFSSKNRFLSDYVVEGCPKYIFGKHIHHWICARPPCFLNLFVPVPQPIVRKIPYIRLGNGDEKVKGGGLAQIQ